MAAVDGVCGKTLARPPDQVGRFTQAERAPALEEAEVVDSTGEHPDNCALVLRGRGYRAREVNGLGAWCESRFPHHSMYSSVNTKTQSGPSR